MSWKDYVARVIGLSLLSIPKDDKNIVFYSQGGVFANLFYLYRMLKDKNFKLCWIEKNSHIAPLLSEIGINVIVPSRFQELRIISTAKYILSSNGIPITKNSNQIAIELWHGIPLKRIGKYQKGIDIKTLSYRSRLMNFFIASSEFTRFIFSSVFNLNYDKILVLGYPTADVLINTSIQKSKKILKNIYCDIDQFSNLFLYAPTFRDYFSFDIFKLISNKTLQNFLESANSLLLLKLHPSLESKIENKLRVSTNIRLLTQRYLLSQNSLLYDILPAVDVLITDYSSVYFDYLLLNRPIVFYIPDLEKYRETRGFLLEPYEKWTPGDKARTPEELVVALEEAINNPKKWERERLWLRDVMFKYQDGKASERIIKYFWGDI